MQKKVASVAPGVYYYRGRYWSALTWSKPNRQPVDGDATLAKQKQSSHGKRGEEGLSGALGQVGEPTPAASKQAP